MSTDTEITQFLNSKKLISDSVLKSEKFLQRNYPSFYRMFLGYRNSQNIEDLMRMNDWCDIMSINWLDVLPFAMQFINCDEHSKPILVKKYKISSQRSKPHKQTYDYL